MITKDYVAEVVRHCLVLSSENDIMVSVQPHVESVTLRVYVGKYENVKGNGPTDALAFYYGSNAHLNELDEEATKKEIEEFVSKYAK